MQVNAKTAVEEATAAAADTVVAHSRQTHARLIEKNHLIFIFKAKMSLQTFTSERKHLKLHSPKLNCAHHLGSHS
jgi:hypothetical protein